MKLDHITVVARSLEEGLDHIRSTLGIEMPVGGTHPRMGTHNRLMALGSDSFLELIAIDPNAPPPGRPRWFGLDRFDGPPRLATWVVGVADIQAELMAGHPASGEATPITRGELRWMISIPGDGSMPLDGAYPTLIEWPPGRHPAASMIDLGCRLTALRVTHPRAGEIEAHLGYRIDLDLIDLRRGPTLALEADIATPNGPRILT
jgi:hypothetical protein